jgi:hypothetical protein
MNVLYSNHPPFDGSEAGIFLAGPTPRSPDVPSWRPQAVELLRGFGFTGTVLVPEWDTGVAKASYDDQVGWERAGLIHAKAIAFWVPRNMATMPALTTNVEFGYWLAKTPKRVFYGRPPGAPSTKYLDWLLHQDLPNAMIYDRLEALLEATVRFVEKSAPGS